jgi:hypothetical protein
MLSRSILHPHRFPLTPSWRVGVTIYAVLALRYIVTEWYCRSQFGKCFYSVPKIKTQSSHRRCYLTCNSLISQLLPRSRSLVPRTSCATHVVMADIQGFIFSYNISWATNTFWTIVQFSRTLWILNLTIQRCSRPNRANPVLNQFRQFYIITTAQRLIPILIFINVSVSQVFSFLVTSIQMCNLCYSLRKFKSCMVWANENL